MPLPVHHSLRHSFPSSLVPLRELFQQPSLVSSLVPSLALLQVLCLPLACDEEHHHHHRRQKPEDDDPLAYDEAHRPHLPTHRCYVLACDEEHRHRQKLEDDDPSVCDEAHRPHLLTRHCYVLACDEARNRHHQKPEDDDPSVCDEARNHHRQRTPHDETSCEEPRPHSLRFLPSIYSQEPRKRRHLVYKTLLDELTAAVAIRWFWTRELLGIVCS